ncbi:hypothetical protein EHM92_00290 [bacterium]|nr:MAG: hypothetical protein EHM92_00290 [bacterium]
MPLTKLLMRIWLGPLPLWIDKWWANVETLKPYGFHFLLLTDYEDIRQRCHDVLGIQIRPYQEIAGTRISAASGPAYGELFADKCKGYDFWGHCDQDTVFGRLDRFVSDEYLGDCDIFGNDPDAICGPFSLYRNCEKVNALYRKVPNWQQALSGHEFVSFEEGLFVRTVRKAAAAGEIYFKSAFWQVDYKKHEPVAHLKILTDGSLIDLVAGKETMMFHFNHIKHWPFE